MIPRVQLPPVKREIERAAANYRRDLVRAQQDAVERLAIFGHHDFKAFLAQVASEQVADAGIVIDDQNLVCAGIGSVHGIDLICNKCDFETCNNQKASVLGSISHTVTALSLTGRRCPT